ncbi:unnamed protein product [Candidula unifasciata]|uniref:Uncharacterized protein n=1 Tax=Candidula unifasciata TaxID=100452 RepID=A0A8S3YXB7_9EUPU|nr:unnamed protein product [Candidula unifasciata]
MSSSTLSLQTLSTPSLPPLSLTPTEGVMRDLETDIQDFWSSFPCPPPWKPRLLIEVNASRLDPHVSRTLQSFLAGKCDIRHILSGSDTAFNLEPNDLGSGFDLRPTKGADPGSSVSGPGASHHPWCDATCQLSFGCAVLFVVVVFMVAIVICVTRHRVKNKMAAARPSRQQLQLSTSTSDAFNCAEFSNLEIQGGDDLVYPPFRHRGLPHPPLSCHPSCNSKWNCPNCSSCHPLMKLSPPDLYYSRGYSAVYETIDDDEEEEVFQGTITSTRNASGCLSPATPESGDFNQSWGPCVASSEISTVQIRPRPFDDNRHEKTTAETGFNGHDRQRNNSKSTLPRYFELEHNCALVGNYENNSMKTFETRNVPEEGSCFAFTVSGSNHSCLLSHNQTIFKSPPMNSSTIDQGQGGFSPTTADFQTFRLNTEQFKQKYSDNANDDDSQQTEGQSLSFSNRNSEYNMFPRDNTSNFNDRRRPSTLQTHLGQGPGHLSHFPYTTHASPAPTFLSDIPSSYFCSGCQPSSNPLLRVHPKRLTPTSLQTNPTFPGVIVGPDLLKEASNSRRTADKETTPVNEHNDDNNEVPLRKPVLALHSQYFAKPSLT